ncbi:phage protein NinX family protein [Erwinia aphidicola]|uniref:phage protein NinX family protein n=1 Tax=Erwinia aphidicola TaxID=68334 RepID=UPI003016A763
MDYSKLSGAGIASKVLIAQGYKLIDDGYGYSIYISESGRKDIGPKASKQFLFDPCNNAADAWPIIAENMIALNPVKLFVGGHRWFASKGDSDLSEKASDENPLRAAMIVYLMMQESE